MTRIVMLALCLAALGAAPTARAQAASGKTAAQADAGAATAAAPARVRASHRVDVIAPGEKVDSVVSRLRTGAASTPDGAGMGPAGRGARQGDRAEDRPPASARGGRPGPGAPGAGAAGPPPATGGGRMGGGMAPPDRPHR
jgi:hypothetical protein